MMHSPLRYRASGLWVVRLSIKQSRNHYFMWLRLCFLLISWLTHTPYITSGHGWTLVNVGFSWRFRHFQLENGFLPKNDFFSLFWLFRFFDHPPPLFRGKWPYYRGKYPLSGVKKGQKTVKTPYFPFKKGGYGSPPLFLPKKAIFGCFLLFFHEKTSPLRYRASSLDR